MASRTFSSREMRTLTSSQLGREAFRPGSGADSVDSPLLSQNSMYVGQKTRGLKAELKRRRADKKEPPSRSCNCCCIVCADQSVKVIVQNFGQLESIRDAGLHLLKWPFQTAALVSLKVRMLDVTTNSKTLDNVTVQVRSSVQYQVEADRVDEFLFRLNDPASQIESFVEDGIRSMLPSMTLDDAFLSKTAIGDTVCRQTEKEMEAYGVTILAVLVAELRIAPEVSAAMNEIEASKREREACVHKAEANKIMVVSRAEADAEAMHLQGIGLARQRVAMCDGISQSIEAMREQETGVDQREVLYMTLAAQYMEVLSDFAASSPASCVLPPPGGARGLPPP
eukprot:CAMPEP_0172005214 /NCGR_PEP_ID=MMETSP1041-20130122/4918_1 /TAXON_ID=464988 /ORGANISM="Hemiselmis andersenii, Strain CCMP439" /LENGTH=338 /DNA_ID=CAMNT_0012659175 /DNA_START=350 /DNA_END=1362 /DNA_ORIENTATION=-